METALLFLMSLSVTIELFTLHHQMLLVYTDTKKANKVLLKNWQLVFIYGLVAIIVFPITIFSVIIDCRGTWEEKLFNSIKNNLYIKEKV